MAEEDRTISKGIGEIAGKGREGNRGRDGWRQEREGGANTLDTLVGLLQMKTVDRVGFISYI